MEKTTTHDCEIVGELNQMTNSRWEHLNKFTIIALNIKITIHIL